MPSVQRAATIVDWRIRELLRPRDLGRDLRFWQYAAVSGLGTLGKFDLNHVYCRLFVYCLPEEVLVKHARATDNDMVPQQSILSKKKLTW